MSMLDHRLIPEPSLKPTVLVVEDNPTNVLLAQRLLEKGGYRVVVASNGRDGVEAAKQQLFDVIFMDVQMPFLDGREATMEIRRLEGWAGQVPIVAFTASVMTHETRQCFEAGMDDFIGKPFRMDQLVEKCRYWINRRPMTTAQYAEAVSK